MAKICKNQDVVQNLQLIAEHSNLNYSTVHRHALKFFIRSYFEKYMPEQLVDEIITFDNLIDTKTGKPIQVNIGHLTNQQTRELYRQRNLAKAAGTDAARKLLEMFAPKVTSLNPVNIKSIAGKTLSHVFKIN